MTGKPDDPDGEQPDDEGSAHHEPEPKQQDPKPAKPEQHEPERPVIEYPCHWRYRVIGKDTVTLRAVIATILGDREYALTEGNTSSGGKYRSLELDVVVDDDAMRLAIFSQLTQSSDIAFVI